MMIDTKKMIDNGRASAKVFAVFAAWALVALVGQDSRGWAIFQLCALAVCLWGLLGSVDLARRGLRIREAMDDLARFHDDPMLRAESPHLAAGLANLMLVLNTAIK